jgi:hypothetical protein
VTAHPGQETEEDETSGNPGQGIIQLAVLNLDDVQEDQDDHDQDLDHKPAFFRVASRASAGGFCFMALFLRRRFLGRLMNNPPSNSVTFPEETNHSLTNVKQGMTDT